MKRWVIIRRANPLATHSHCFGMRWDGPNNGFFHLSEAQEYARKKFLVDVEYVQTSN